MRDYAFVQHVKAPNDANGNPRRLYMVTRASTQESCVQVYAVDEDYNEGGNLIRELRAASFDVVELPPVNVSAAEYRRLLNEHKTPRYLR